MKNNCKIFISMIGFCLVFSIFKLVSVSSKDILDKTDPSSIYKYYFKTPINEIKNLKGTYNKSLDHDFYIRFESNAEIILKHQDNYEPFNHIEAVFFFFEYFPEDAEYLSDEFNLSCVIKKESDNDIPLNGERLLMNRKAGVYFFWSYHD